MDYQFSATLPMPYPQAVAEVRNAVAEQGFGVLSEIDVKATLHAKRGIDLEDYLILGVCNPDLAHRALEIDRALGVLLPCTVVVRASGDASSVVSILDPQAMAPLTGQEDLAPIADEASRRLRAALGALTASP